MSNQSASISFTPPLNNGGSTITGYTVRSTPDNIAAVGSSSPIIVSGLTNGTSYTFTVHATNINGDGPESDPSNVIIPLGSSDPYLANVVLLLHGDGVNGSTTIVDSSILANPVFVGNNAQLSIEQSKFGGTSIVFLNSQQSYLSITNNALWTLGDTWTVEYWSYSAFLNNAANLSCGQYQNPGQVWDSLQVAIRYIDSTTGTRFYFSATTNYDEKYLDVTVIPADQWNHIAMVRSGTTGTVYINGILAGTISDIAPPVSATRPLYIGLWDYSYNIEYFAGYIDDLRITKGVARYTTTFTPPTQPFPSS